MRLLSLSLLLVACAKDDPDLAPLDLTPPPPDLTPCPTYPPGGGGGKGRPEVWVRGGPYVIEGTALTVKDFYLDVFEVTVRAYRDCVNDGKCTKPATTEFCTWSEAPGSKEDHPINCVTWFQADAFCRWAGRQLPSESEWEYAAAGPRTTVATGYPWGQDEPREDAAQQLCFDRNTSGEGTCSVGSYEKTLLGGRACGGVADLAGNVWEWTRTSFRKPYLAQETACAMTSAGCSLRGGAWIYTDPKYFRVVHRPDDAPTFQRSDTGLRCSRAP